MILHCVSSPLGERSEDLALGDMCDSLGTDSEQQAAMEMYTALSDGEIQVSKLTTKRSQAKVSKIICFAAD